MSMYCRCDVKDIISEDSAECTSTEPSHRDQGLKIICPIHSPLDNPYVIHSVYSSSSVLNSARVEFPALGYPEKWMERWERVRSSVFEYGVLLDKVGVSQVTMWMRAYSLKGLAAPLTWLNIDSARLGQAVIGGLEDLLRGEYTVKSQESCEF